MTLDGLRAVKELSEEGIKTNVTLVFSPLQALMAAKAGATYISPFVGRLDDIALDGMKVVEQIIDIFANYLFEAEVIVASIRNPCMFWLRPDWERISPRSPSRLLSNWPGIL